MLCLEEEMEGRGFQDKEEEWGGAAPPCTATVDSGFIRKRNRAELPRAIGGRSLLRKRERRRAGKVSRKLCGPQRGICPPVTTGGSESSEEGSKSRYGGRQEVVRASD